MCEGDCEDLLCTFCAARFVNNDVFKHCKRKTAVDWFTSQLHKFAIITVQSNVMAKGISMSYIDPVKGK